MKDIRDHRKVGFQGQREKGYREAPGIG
uniref:Uncharacterized protein n=1 Tax=Nelumbo nucifera TaxID=4432 RepID=A0A822YM39_NELNU|nr:TPA_asm: hypothetical protein HUJ06_011502 [Nelumbo nucifera]